MFAMKSYQGKVKVLRNNIWTEFSKANEPVMNASVHRKDGWKTRIPAYRDYHFTLFHWSAFGCPQQSQ